MSVRKFLTKHTATSRTALVSAVLFLSGVIAGCTSSVSHEDMERGIDHPTRDAAMIAEARAIDLQDEINRLQQQQDDLERKRSDCLDQAASYRAKSAAVWSDPSVSEGERPSLADQFNSMADRSEAKAYRYGLISQACASRISLLKSQRYDQLRRAENYQNMSVPSPASQ